jgi:drug/metabolite transporter (DMT)-like permease
MVSKTRSKAFLALAAVSFLWGTTWVASRQGVQYVPALELAGIRQLLAGLVFVSFFLFRRFAWPSKGEWKNIFLMSLLNLFLTNGLNTLSVQYIPAGLASIISAIFPLWLAVLGFFTTRTAIPGKAILGLLIGFGGICVIFSEHLKDLLEPAFRSGILISLAASISWAFGSLYTRRQIRSFNPYFSIALQMIISGILLLGVSFIWETPVPIGRISANAWWALGYLVIFGSLVTFIAYLYALQHLPAEQVSIYAYINPMVAVLIGSSLFGELFTAWMGLGGALALFGVYLVNQSYKKRNPGAGCQRGQLSQ